MTARPKQWRRTVFALRKAALGLGGVCCALQSPPLHAQETVEATAAAPMKRPRVGLVLSGGGALGMSHIGVLEVLEKLRVPVDCVTGTSFGAIIGGLYAAGRAPDELEQAVKTIDWDVALGSQARRQDRSYRRKSDDEGYLIPYKLGLENGEIKSPPGLVSNVNLTQIIRALAQRDDPAFDFKDLPIPFWAVAADLKTGDEVVLSKGNLVAAIVASMSVPGLFPATEIDGHKLVDGGIANNVPISVAREQCHADKLIVVNLSRPPESYGDLDDFAGVLGQMVNIMTYRNARAQLDTLHDDDILLTPALQDFEFTDFNRAEKIVPRGRAAALAAAERLKALSASPRDWAVYIETLRPKVPLPEPVIAEIKIDNDSRLSDQVVRSALGVEPGQRLDRKALSKGISKLHGLDYFDSINYAIENQADGRAAVDISVRERRWARKHFRFGLALEDNFNGESSYRLGMSYTVLGLNRRGGEWRSQLEMGTDQRLASEIYQPIDDRQTYFGAVAVDLSRTSLSLRDELGIPVSIIGVNAAMAEARLGRVFGNWGALSLTGNYRIYGLERRAGPEPAAGFFSGARDESNMGLRFDVDTIDKVSFPRHGVQFQAAYMIDPAQASPFKNGRLAASGFAAWSWGENTLIASSLLATNLSDDESLQDYFSLGGFLSMSGYARNELAGPHVTQAGLIYLRRLNEQSNPILDLPFYLGLTMEAGQVWRNTGDFRLEDLILGGSLVLGADTPLGPVYLAGGRNSDGRSSLFLYLGQIF